MSAPLGDDEVGRHSANVAQIDSTPTAKVTAGSLTAALVVVLISVAKSFHIELEPEVAAALVAMSGTAAAYFKKSRPGDNDR